MQKIAHKANLEPAQGHTGTTEGAIGADLGFTIVPTSQLGQVASDDDATSDAPNRGVFAYVEVKEHHKLLSQRREMPQLPLLQGG